MLMQGVRILEAKFELFSKTKFGVLFIEKDYENMQKRTKHQEMEGISIVSQEWPIMIEDEDPQKGSFLVRTKMQQLGK
jgi:hypothetical protein